MKGEKRKRSNDGREDRGGEKTEKRKKRELF